MLRATFLLALLAAPAAAQNTWYVDDDACPFTGNGTQGIPFCRIQDAIDAATSGDLVLVQPGGYPETVDFGGREIEVRSLAGPSRTTIYGGARFESGEGPGAVFEGFRVEAGAPAIRCIGSSPTIEGNVFQYDFAFAEGGGISLRDSSATVRRNFLADDGDTAGPGGALSAFGGTPVLDGNTFLRCYTEGSGLGGAVYLESCAATVSGNVFLRNTVESMDAIFAAGGGGLYAKGCDLVLSGNTFSENTVLDPMVGSGQGGAVALEDSRAVLVDDILWRDLATNGSELSIQGGTVPTVISYSILEGGSAAVVGAAHAAFGQGVLDVDPLFVRPGYDVHLQAGSPAVDAGWPGLPATGLDGDGEPRVLDGDGDGAARVDIGRDELDPTTLVAQGDPLLGGSLQLTTAAPAGELYALAYSLGRFDFPLPPYGSLLLDPTALTLVGAGSVPGSDTVAVPADPALVGVQAFFQAFARALPRVPGAFSRRLELTIR